MKRRLTAFLLVICLLVLSLSPCMAAGSTALPRSAGVEALRRQFKIGYAPAAGGYSLDYAYYAPAEGGSVKYPLVIFLHGIGHGGATGSQIADSDMAYWASAELQARFRNGGGYILLPRAPEERTVYWSESLVESLRALIDDFIRLHPNIDTSRICIGGSSAGGAMVWNMLAAFPEYFATAFPIASTESPTDAGVAVAADTAIWMFASSKDPVISYIGSTLPIWNAVKSTNSKPAACRLTTFGEVYNPDGEHSSDNHHLAKVVTSDMFTLTDGVYPDASTQNGNGSTVSLVCPNGIIAWISANTSAYNGEAGTGTGNLNVSILDNILNTFKNFFLRIVNLFQKLFGL